MLPLDKAVKTETSTVEVESVGRLLVKLEKAEETYWSALLPSEFTRPKNLSLGWEMQSRYDEELKTRFPDEFKDNEEGKPKGVFSPPVDKPEEIADDDDQEEESSKKPKKKKKSKSK